MNSLAHHVARRYVRADANLWEGAQKDLQEFNQRYEEIHRLYKANDIDAIDKLLNEFAFRKNGTAPSFQGSNFHKWMVSVFQIADIDDPDAARPQGVMIMAVLDGDMDIEEDFFKALDVYRDALQAVVDATAPAKFNYHGFDVENHQHMGDALCRRLLEGVDYVVALFKKRGLEKLLTNEVRKIDLSPDLEGSKHGLYWPQSKIISLSAKILGKGGLGTFVKWVNEVFLHEIGHHVHLNYITGEAREVWDSAWAEVKEKKEVIEQVFKQISQAERKKFHDALMDVGWEPAKAAKKLNAVERVKFGVWLRTPMSGPPLITDKQFRLTKDGQSVAHFFRDTKGYMTERYSYDGTEDPERVKEDVARVFKQMMNKLGLSYAGNYPIPSSIVEELAKADPSMHKTVEEALAKLDIVSPYGKTDEMEDFAETFVAFVGAPSKLTPTAKFRMQRTLSVSGLYGKQVMRLARRVAERYLAATVIPFQPKKPTGPTLAIGGRKYALSDYFPMLSDMAGDEEVPGGARLIKSPPRFSYLWAYDVDKKHVAMWRVSDGDEKAGGSASHYISNIVTLERKGQLNRVTHQEFQAIERHMNGQYQKALADMKAYLAENASEWDKESKIIAEELFQKQFLPRILAKFREVEQGVKPLGFKVDEHRLSHRSAEDQAKMFVAQQILKDYTVQAVEDYARTKGHDPANPPGDHQALQWAHGDALEAFYDEYFR